MQRNVTLALAALGFLTLPSMAHAYIGPGLGAGVIATVLGVLAAIVMAFVAVLWYPVKRMLRRKPAETAGNQGET